MLHRRLLLLVVCLPLAHAGSAPVTWSLAGQWRVHDANDSAFAGAQASDGDWRTLRVPANWYSAGYDHQAPVVSPSIYPAWPDAGRHGYAGV